MRFSTHCFRLIWLYIEAAFKTPVDSGFALRSSGERILDPDSKGRPMVFRTQREFKSEVIMKKILICLTAVAACVLIVCPLSSQNATADQEKEAVKKTVVDAYVDGLFLKGDPALIKKGFHPDCDVLILNKGNLVKVHAYSYVERLEENPGPLHAGTTYQFSDVQVMGYAGLAVVEIFQEANHIYTDYLSLYKFADGWKIVTKIYYRHPDR